MGVTMAQVWECGGNGPSQHDQAGPRAGVVSTKVANISALRRPTSTPFDPTYRSYLSPLFDRTRFGYSRNRPYLQHAVILRKEMRCAQSIPIIPNSRYHLRQYEGIEK